MTAARGALQPSARGARVAPHLMPPDDTRLAEEEAGAEAAPDVIESAASDIEWGETTAEPGRAGPEVIAAAARTLPNAPGVYRMLDADGDVLYVGKAKSLRARVGSYARGQTHSNRIARVIAETASM